MAVLESVVLDSVLESTRGLVLGLPTLVMDWSALRSMEAWRELLGRLHPVLVHFPISFILLAAVLEWGAVLLRRARTEGAWASPTARVCLYIGVVAAIGAVISGWTRASVAPIGSSEASMVFIHRWSAVGAAVCALLAALPMRRARPRTMVRLALLLSATLVGIAGHFGGSLVHGSQHLFEPFMRAPTAVEAGSGTDAESGLDASSVGGPFVVPISRNVEVLFAEHCLECHGPRRKRGNLRLDDGASIARSGTVVPGDPAASELLRRVLLPADDPDAMPPVGDPRLTPGDVDVLRAWITSVEATRTTTEQPAVIDLAVEEQPAVLSDAAIERHQRAVDALIDRGVAVAPMMRDSAMVSVHLNLLGTSVTDETVTLLRGLEPTLVVLDLTGTAITDEAGEVLSTMHAVEELSLARTATGDALIRSISALPSLRSLNLFGTAVTDDAVAAIAEMPALEVVYLYDTGVTTTALTDLAAMAPDLRVVVDGE